MRVLYLAKGSAAYPSSRYRAYQFQAPLAELGVELQIEPLFGDAWMRSAGRGAGLLRRVRRGALGLAYALRRLGSLLRRPEVDLVIVEQELVPLLPAGIERLLLGASCPLVIEVDDAHHLLPFKAAKLGAWFGGAQKVIVGNEVLAQAVRSHGGTPVVVPTVIEIGRFDAAHTAVQDDLEPDQPLRLVWVGLGGNIDQLFSVRSALETAIAERMIELAVVTSPDAELDGLDAALIPWSAAAEQQELAAAHIGIMPLPETPWAAGKCALKLLQYQAAGLACVASPVGMNRSFEGLGSVILAADPGAWLDAFATLRDGATRRRLALRGRALVASQYSVSVWAPRLAAIYRTVAAGR